MEETRTLEAPDQRDRHVIRRTAELLASDVPLRDVFSQFCRLLSSVIDASRDLGVFVTRDKPGDAAAGGPTGGGEGAVEMQRMLQQWGYAHGSH